MGGAERGDVAFDDWMHSKFNFEPRKPLIMRHLDKAPITVTEMHCRSPDPEKSSPIPSEESLLVTIHVDNSPAYDLWFGSRFMRTNPLKAGTTVMYDLRTEPSVRVLEEFHHVSFHMPKAALKQIADREGYPPTDEFELALMDGHQDEVLATLGRTILPCLRQVDQVNHLFSDHVTMATASQVLRTYGVRSGRPLPPLTQPRPLSPWQKAMACEMLRAHLDGKISLDEIASQCGLPALEFARSFRVSTGMPPWKWLEACAIATVRDILLIRPFIPLDQASKICGFSDPTHLVAAFIRNIGVHPTTWRVQH
jgi:AraC family transcriptional regulator